MEEGGAKRGHGASHSFSVDRNSRHGARKLSVLIVRAQQARGRKSHCTQRTEVKRKTGMIAVTAIHQALFTSTARCRRAGCRRCLHTLR